MRFHMVCPDGVYVAEAPHPPIFRHVPAPTGVELQALVQKIAERIGNTLERRRLIERDIENAWLADDRTADVAMSWAKRLKRVFGIEREDCVRCGGLKVIASIEEPNVIARSLEHMGETAPDPQQAELPLGARARRCSHG